MRRCRTSCSSRKRSRRNGRRDRPCCRSRARPSGDGCGGSRTGNAQVLNRRDSTIRAQHSSPTHSESQLSGAGSEKPNAISMCWKLVLNHPSQQPRRETAPRERISGIPAPVRSTPLPRTLRNTADFWGGPKRGEFSGCGWWRGERNPRPTFAGDGYTAISMAWYNVDPHGYPPRSRTPG